MTDAVERLQVRGRRIRETIVLLYCVSVFVGICLINSRSDNSLREAYLALRDLPKDHLIIPGDLKPQDLPAFTEADLAALPPPVGRYLRSAAQKKGPVDANLLTDSPEVRIPRGYSAVAFSVPPALIASGLLDVHSKVSICASDCTISGVPVAAVLCDKGLSACTVILEVNGDQAKAIVSHPASDERLIVDSTSDP